MADAADMQGLYPRLSYLTLLNIHPERTAAALRACAEVERAADIDRGLHAALGQVNWRPHLLACGVLLVRRQRAPITPALLAALWARIDDWSWAVPQLCASAALLDPAFVEQARGRFERFTTDGPEGGPSAKAMQALVALAGLPTAGLSAAQAAWLADSGLRVERAVEWRDRMRAVLAGPWDAGP